MPKPDDQADDRVARVKALARFIDWAEREAVSLKVSDCGVCLQLARVALLSRDGAWADESRGGEPDGSESRSR